MSLIIFRNLVTQKVCNDKECAVLSHLICAGEEQSLAELQDAFSTMRKSSLEAMLESFYCRGWIDLETRKVQGDDQPHIFITIEPVIIRRILERCKEGIDHDLGKKIDAVRKIFEADDDQPATGLRGDDLAHNVDSSISVPSNLSQSQPQPVETNTEPSYSNPTNVGEAATSPTDFSAYEDDTPKTCADDPAVQRLFEKNRQETIERRKRRAFSIPTRERVIEEGARYIDAAKERYPHLADIDMDKAADNFLDFYNSKGWKVGNQPMKDWQSALMRALREWKMPLKEKSPDEKFAWVDKLFDENGAVGESGSDIVDAQFTEEPEEDDDSLIGPSAYELEDLANREV